MEGREIAEKKAENKIKISSKGIDPKKRVKENWKERREGKKE